MSLRARLVVVFAVVIVALVTSVTLVVGYQRDFLIDQIDTELRSAGNLVITDPGFVPGIPLPSEQPIGPGPISDLFVALRLPDGSLFVRTRGQLLEDVPALDIDGPATATDDTRFFTADGVETDQTFRVRATPLPDGNWAIVAQPLAETDAAINRLLLMLVLGSLLVVLALALAMWWVVRLGLRPIAAMTRTVTAIAEGDRGQRVATAPPSSETGKLGAAFNDMMDQRDAAESRLRQFVADASHELRTPLTSIRGYLDLSLEGGFADDQRDDVMRRIRAESRRMNDLVEDLLLLANLDEGRPLRTDPVDLRAVARDAVSDAKAMQPARDIQVAGEADAPLLVTGDDMRLRQVVAALVQNAIDHTPPETHVVLQVAAADDAVELSVTDDGPGMDAEAAAKVFDRFSRGDSSRSRQGGGAGLGLAIATSIVQAHGGTLTVHTAVGQGCSFRMRLPRAELAMK